MTGVQTCALPISLLPLLFSQDLMVAAVCLSLGFFFAELTIGPMWAIPMESRRNSPAPQPD